MDCSAQCIRLPRLFAVVPTVRRRIARARTVLSCCSTSTQCVRSFCVRNRRRHCPVASAAREDGRYESSPRRELWGESTRACGTASSRQRVRCTVRTKTAGARGGLVRDGAGRAERGRAYVHSERGRSPFAEVDSTPPRCRTRPRSCREKTVYSLKCYLCYVHVRDACAPPSARTPPGRPPPTYRPPACCPTTTQCPTILTFYFCSFSSVRRRVRVPQRYEKSTAVSRGPVPARLSRPMSPTCSRAYLQISKSMASVTVGSSSPT